MIERDRDVIEVVVYFEFTVANVINARLQTLHGIEWLIQPRVGLEEEPEEGLTVFKVNHRV